VTIAVGMLDRVRGCWIGVDSLEQRGDTHRTVDKLVHRHGLVAALSGHMALADAVGEAIDAALEGEELPLQRFRKELRTILDTSGWISDGRDGQPAWRDFAFLLTDGVSLVEFSGSLHVYPVKYGEFSAIGSGYEIALGAAHAMLGVGGVLPEMVVRRALDAAIAHGLFCGSPARVIHVEPRSRIRP